MATGVAQGDLTNGDFSNGNADWNIYGGAEGPYGVGFFGGSSAVVAYGTFSGVPNYSGASQDITGYAEGDTIEFGGQMYIEAGKELYGTNSAAIKLTFWYGDGTSYGFDVVAGIVDSNSASDTLFSYDGNFLLDAGAASATRISFDFSYIQSDIPPGVTESGAAWGTNFYANVVPSPGALALLGLAGFSGRRRRQS
jgi:MYXO-CTERM domain-containing protein